MLFVKEVTLIWHLALNMLHFLPLAHYIIIHSSLQCRTAVIFTHTHPPPNWCSMSSWVKDPFQSLAMVEWTGLCISFFMHTYIHRHRRCFCWPRMRKNATPMPGWGESSSQGSLQSQSNQSMMSLIEMMLCAGSQWKVERKHTHTVNAMISL